MQNDRGIFLKGVLGGAVLAALLGFLLALFVAYTGAYNIAASQDHSPFVRCHAGPGVERAEWAQGLLPQPPHLVEEAAHWQSNEVFWLVKHGVRMSAMPAFGETHKDAELWDIAAFVKQLPGMTASEYAALGQQTGTHKH